MGMLLIENVLPFVFIGCCTGALFKIGLVAAAAQHAYPTGVFAALAAQVVGNFIYFYALVATNAEYFVSWWKHHDKNRVNPIRTV
jgi:hypothetical protein